MGREATGVDKISDTCASASGDIPIPTTVDLAQFNRNALRRLIPSRRSKCRQHIAGAVYSPDYEGTGSPKDNPACITDVCILLRCLPRGRREEGLTGIPA